MCFRPLVSGLTLALLTIAPLAHAATGKPADDPAPLTKVAEYHLAAARSGAAAVAIAPYIYLLGGSDGPNVLGEILRFDPQTGKTVTMKGAIYGRRYHSAAAYGRKIYVFGGISGYDGEPPLESVQVYDVDTDTVSMLGKSPMPVENAGAVTWKNRIYVIGGSYFNRNIRHDMSVVSVYLPDTNTWEKGPAMPTPRECTATAVGGLIVVAGGRAHTRELPTMEVLDPADGSWRALPALCRDMAGAPLLFLGQHLYLFGDDEAMHAVVSYDLRARTSREISPGFDPRRRAAAVVHNGALYVFGGQDMRRCLDTIEVFKPAGQMEKPKY